MSLAGRTIFITGASRGIGKAIALRCAQDGANIVIAAKSATPHPKLPGTIYTAAEEIESAGGKALACIVDVQSEEQVQQAVNSAVEKFGGIDALINNASAISLTGTEGTPMKRYDLMHHINTRGTFLCSKAALPILKKSSNPHILNISPPLNMNPRWFKDHCAYTMAKYGMSMCALGMAAEFKEDGVAVNCLWPQTAIYTAAMEMLGGGDAVKSQCRTVDIMSDAAHVILSKDSRSLTGKFCIDEDVLRENGMTDFEKYSVVPGSNLLPDFFLDTPEMDNLLRQMADQGGQLPFPPTKATTGGATGGNSEVDKTFSAIKSMMSPDLVKTINGVFAFNLKEGGTYHLDLKNGAGAAGKGDAPSGADVTFTMSSVDFVKMFAGKINPTSAFMSGKMKIKGDLGLAMKLEKLMKQMNKAKL